MGYAHIDNLYKNGAVTAFKQVYALEKIHGTSAHLTFKRNTVLNALTEEAYIHDTQKGEVVTPSVSYFSGGASYESFKAIFDEKALLAAFEKLGPEELTVYGEAYGGKMQGMKDTYGPNLKFVAFDVQCGDKWLNIPSAHLMVTELGLDFVAYELVDATPEILDRERDRPSRQAIKNGITEPKISEGIVIRPPFEVTTNNGSRLVAKHKRPEFSERASKADTSLDPAKALALVNAEAIAQEWVVPMRLSHVLDKLRVSLSREPGMPDARLVIDAMVEDVLRESHGEVADTKENRKAIGNQAVKLFRKIPTETP